MGGVCTRAFRDALWSFEPLLPQSSEADPLIDGAMTMESVGEGGGGGSQYIHGGGKAVVRWG